MEDRSQRRYGDDLLTNPFVALFTNIEQAKLFSEETAKALESGQVEAPCPYATNKPDFSEDGETEPAIDEVPDVQKDINKIAEKIFNFTLNSDPTGRKHGVNYFPDIAETYKENPVLDASNVGHILFEVLMLDRHHADFIITHQLDDERGISTVDESLESNENLTYLFCCYRRCLNAKWGYEETNCEEVKEFIAKAETIIVDNAATCLQQPMLFQFQDLMSQFLHLCAEEELPVNDPFNYGCRFLQKICEVIDEGDQVPLQQVVSPILQEVKSRLFEPEITIGHRDVQSYCRILHFFTLNKSLATIFMSHNTPEPPRDQAHSRFLGRKYEDTPIGALLSVSILPRKEIGPYHYFSDPTMLTKQEMELVDNSVWQYTRRLCEGIHKIFVDLMKVDPDIKHYTLRWLGLCIQGNADRSKIWAINQPAEFFVSDAFAINITHVMLLFCRPFSQPNSLKILKIQPSYAMATANGDNEMLRRSVHLLGLHKETCLIPADDVEKIEEDDTFTFITEMFFSAHRSLQVFLQPVITRLINTNRDLAQIQRMYHDMIQQAPANSEPVQDMKLKMENAMSVYLNRKTALTQPDLLLLSFKFQIASSSWLNLICTQSQSSLAEIKEETNFPVIEFPLSESPVPVLAVIPEFVMENIINAIKHMYRFMDGIFESVGNDLEHLFTMVLIFMVSSRRVKNPHLRAELASMLSSLMPMANDEESGQKVIGPQLNRQQLFANHPQAMHVSEAIMNIFVSIEMTGESVAFEQKFNYRRPMYSVLRYIWKIQAHQDKIKILAKDAEEKVLSSDPPLFLRFINLLVNDATFLLDEALLYMSQIKEKQQERERGDWTNMPEAQRHQEEANLTQISRMAQYHNIMGLATISTLNMITTEVKSIFCHSTFVDRMASMLNYFLVKLVGPKQKEFTVKDKKNYDFKPQEMVHNISSIYLNLQSSDLFCQAILEDERSYSSELFPQVCIVLEKIGDHKAINDFMELDSKLKEMKKQKVSQEQALTDAPEEFLDPIMGTLMTDPVMLPASKNIVDRTVIARHILSDQTDPFNRQPLSLDMVIPQTELKTKIEEWRAGRMKNL